MSYRRIEGAATARKDFRSAEYNCNRKNMNEFERFASLDRGISPMTLGRYSSAMDAYINPTVIEERKMNMAQLDVFSRLLLDRVIWLGCPIDNDVANIVQAQLLFLASSDDKADISLYINSPGGSVSAGLGIIDTMELIKPDVATICTGMAASMGSVLLCAGEKGKRSILPHAKVMIHQVSGGTGRAQCSDIQIVANEIRKTQDELCSIIAANSGQSVEKVASDMDRDYWMSSAEALQYGMVDRILRKRQ